MEVIEDEHLMKQVNEIWEVENRKTWQDLRRATENREIT